jgi:dipeptidyl aminopeptidase/acylaminoacyl peptidase
MVKKHSIDENKVFLIGGSGGGHMALMMAAYAPKKFRAISAWCPITDLTAWHGQNAGYAPEVEACCGGKPLSSPEVDREYRERSPLFHVAGMANANLSVHHGRFDNLVPYSHTVNLALALEKLLPKNFFFAIFDGGHTILYETAFRWFDKMTQNDIRKDKELTR